MLVIDTVSQNRLNKIKIHETWRKFWKKIGSRVLRVTPVDIPDATTGYETPLIPLLHFWKFSHIIDVYQKYCIFNKHSQIVCQINIYKLVPFNHFAATSNSVYNFLILIKMKVHASHNAIISKNLSQRL